MRIYKFNYDVENQERISYTDAVILSRLPLTSANGIQLEGDSCLQKIHISNDPGTYVHFLETTQYSCILLSTIEVPSVKPQQSRNSTALPSLEKFIREEALDLYFHYATFLNGRPRSEFLTVEQSFSIC